MSDTTRAQAHQQPPTPSPAHERLEVFIGKWINEGHTIAGADVPAVPILTSDVYAAPRRHLTLSKAPARTRTTGEIA